MSSDRSDDTTPAVGSVNKPIQSTFSPPVCDGHTKSYHEVHAFSGNGFWGGRSQSESPTPVSVSPTFRRKKLSGFLSPQPRRRIINFHSPDSSTHNVSLHKDDEINSVIQKLKEGKFQAAGRLDVPRDSSTRLSGSEMNILAPTEL